MPSKLQLQASLRSAAVSYLRAVRRAFEWRRFLNTPLHRFAILSLIFAFGTIVAIGRLVLTLALTDALFLVFALAMFVLWSGLLMFASRRE